MDEEKPKILIVDDENFYIDVLLDLLKNDYKTLVAKDGAQALRRAAADPQPDLILLDILMPGMDGYEVCRQLKRNPHTRDIPVIFLTIKSEVSDEVRGFNLGASDYITKPIRPRVFISRIKALLRRSDRYEVESGDKLAIGNMIIDKERVTVQRGDETIDLAKKEFELLILLASKPGKVFSREEIFNKVWGTDVIVGNRTIDVHIRKLREKIGDDYIKTIKGIGYKFEF